MTMTEIVILLEKISVMLILNYVCNVAVF